MDINTCYTKTNGDWVASASCEFCGFTQRTAATGDKDSGAMNESISIINGHIKTCPDNPNRVVTDLSKFIDDIKSGKAIKEISNATDA